MHSLTLRLPAGLIADVLSTAKSPGALFMLQSLHGAPKFHTGSRSNSRLKLTVHLLSTRSVGRSVSALKYFWLAPALPLSCCFSTMTLYQDVSTFHEACLVLSATLCEGWQYFAKVHWIQVHSHLPCFPTVFRAICALLQRSSSY